MVKDSKLSCCLFVLKWAKFVSNWYKIDTMSVKVVDICSDYCNCCTIFVLFRAKCKQARLCFRLQYDLPFLLVLL